MTIFAGFTVIYITVTVIFSKITNPMSTLHD